MLAWKVAWKAGIATFTTVLSINAMLEARIVAARIHGCASFLQAASVLPERTASSSHGVFIQLWMRQPACEFRRYRPTEDIPPAVHQLALRFTPSIFTNSFAMPFLSAPFHRLGLPAFRR